MQVVILRDFRISFNRNSFRCFLEGKYWQCCFLQSFFLLLICVIVLLSINRFGTKRVRANQVYQEYIADKSHLHMNSTRWVTLTEFVKHLGRSGIAKVDETEKGWFIAWIDSSPKALAKAVRPFSPFHFRLFTHYLSKITGSFIEEGSCYSFR